MSVIVPPGKRRILFVDDDSAILNGLQNLLFRDRKRWDMVFALGGAKALEELRARPFDVVVSDMRMPGIDGAALLGIVKQEFPGTVRIILSGHAEREAIVRALPAMHQFLSKPCDPDRLRAAIDRCLDLVGQPSNDVRALIGRLDKLPSPPAIYIELSHLAGDPNATIDAVSKVVMRDPAVAAKVLQLANSAAFGASRKVTDLGQAVSYLGTELLKCLALTSTVFAPTTRATAAGFSLEEMQARALRTASFARRIVRERKDADAAFAAALLHDIGETMLATGLPEGYAKLRADVRESGEPVIIAERRELGATHADIGGWLLAMWGLPQNLVDVVAHHHEPLGAPAAVQEIAAIVHVADALVDTPEHGASLIDQPFLTSLGLADRLPAWTELARE